MAGGITDGGAPVDVCAHSWSTTNYNLVTSATLLTLNATMPTKTGLGIAVKVCKLCGVLKTQNTASIT